jgi:hypothetical protein
MGKQSAIKVYYHTRNRILYMRRNTSVTQLITFLVFFTLLTTPKTIFKFAFKRQFKHLGSFIKATTWNLTTSKYSLV